MGLTRERVRQIQSGTLTQLRCFWGLVLIKDFISNKIAAYLDQNASSLQGILRADEAPAAFVVGCSTGQALLAMAFFRALFPKGPGLLGQCLLEVENGVFCREDGVKNEYQEALKAIEGTLQERAEPQQRGALLSSAGTVMKIRGTSNAGDLLRRVIDVSPSLHVWPDGTIVLSRWPKVRHLNAAALAEMALGHLGRAAHFRVIAKTIDEMFPTLKAPGLRKILAALSTRQDRFVRVGKGTYRLQAPRQLRGYA